MDDALVFSETEELHWRHLREVLERLKEARLYCKLEKCNCRPYNYVGRDPSGLERHERVKSRALDPTLDKDHEDQAHAQYHKDRDLETSLPIYVSYVEVFGDDASGEHKQTVEQV